MTRKIPFTVAFVTAIGLAGTAGTDVWDTAAFNDNGNTTHSQLTHGFSEVHDLGVQPGPVADQDWYAVTQQAFSSYEVLVDGATGDVVNFSPTLLQRVDSTGAVLQVSAPYEVGFAAARSLRFANDTSVSITNEFVLVANAGCGTACDMEDRYRIRAWETTIAVPRYNNFAGQLTVLIIQNAGPDPVSGNARLWTTAGGSAPVTTVGFSLLSRQATVINLASVNGGVANGTSGTITITHDGRYGALAVKAVALEPATGFSFDSPGLYKPD